MRNISDKCCEENESTFISRNFYKIFQLFDNVKTYSRVGQVTDDSS